jgi:Spy/CpxP family protein refolding chaperone
MDAMKALVCLLLLAAAPAAAQSPPQPPQPPPGEDPIAQRVFPPELIMGHQKEIGLDDKQRAAIVKEIQTAQSQILEVQWQMQGAVEEMVKLLDAPRVDEQKTLAQADKVMELERTLKRTHLGMLIRIRNLLSDGQRAKLSELRRGGAPAPR